MPQQVDPWSDHMIATLPDGAYSTDCTDADFTTCGHWVHGTPQGTILSDMLAAFLKSKMAELN